MATVPGIDVSYWNAGIDWPLREAKDEGPDPGQERCPLPHCRETVPCAELLQRSRRF